MSRTMFTAALSSLVLLGCASDLPRVATTSECRAAECRVAVQATAREIGGCNINAVADRLQVRSRGASVIFWDLEAQAEHAGYRFPANGIVFNDPQGEFDCQSAHQGKKFMCNNKHTKSGEYAYTVNLAKGSTSCIPLDPAIVND